MACAVLMLAAFARRMDAMSLVAQARALGMDSDQLRLSTALAIRSSDHLMQASYIFSALWLLPFGYLVCKSAFVPKTLGVLLMLGVPFYLLSFIDAVLQVDYARSGLGQVVGIISGIPEIVGELGTGVWLLARGTKGGWGSGGARAALHAK